MRRESPLAARMPETVAAKPGQLSPNVVKLYERAFLGHINVRGDPRSSCFAAAAERALGCALPVDANTFRDGEAVRACWLAPGEWLILCHGDDERAHVGALRQSLQGEFAAVTEVSSGQTVLGVSGAHARDIVARGCPLDLHPRVFGPGRCAQSYLARTGIMIMQTSSVPMFELVVRRSYADYVWTWLTDAAAGYSYEVSDAPPWLSAKPSVLEPVMDSSARDERAERVQC